MKSEDFPSKKRVYEDIFDDPRPQKYRKIHRSTTTLIIMLPITPEGHLKTSHCDIY